jgi:hypothetical protein
MAAEGNSEQHLDPSTRNLDDVFGENDPARRRAAIDEIFTEDCVFHEPRGVYRGRDEIDRVATATEATHPDFRYQPLAPPEALGNAGRVRWVRVAQAKRPPTPERISSLPGTAGWPPCTSSSTRYPEASGGRDLASLDAACGRLTKRGL